VKNVRLLFKQRFFSWLDSYDVYDENGKAFFTVEGKLAWGHCLHINDAYGNHIGTVKEEVLTFFVPKFQIYRGDRHVGEIRKEFTFFKPVFTIDCNGWQVNGDFFEWDYQITDSTGRQVAVISKELFNWTDTYVIDVQRPEDALDVLMLVLAIDAEKCSRN